MRTMRWTGAALAAALLVGACSSGSGGSDDATGTGGATTTGETGGTGTTAAPAPAYRSEIYADPAHWLCRGDVADDPCDGDLDATVVAADGTRTVEPFTPAEDPAIDCFYVYPTISSDQTVNSDLDAGTEEVRTVTSQAARLGEVCRVFAPVYRQVTLAALLGTVQGDRAAAGQTAYADVLDAWRHYLANDNDGRGVILIGHSQGSGHLNRLLREEIDPEPTERARIVSAMLLGSAVRVPPGEDVGGDFANLPLCRAADQTGCVISFAAFRSTSPPPANSFFGRVRSGDGVAACTNPAALAGGTAELHGYFPTGEWVLPSDPGAVTTPFVSLPGLTRGECVERDGFSYLEVTVTGGDGPRTQDITGDLTPEWGLHIVDVNLVMGDLVDLARAQADAFTA